jgi:segregation and condensation protein B
VIRPTIEVIRGVDSGWVIRSLLEKGLIRIAGRKEIPGRPLIYGTTKNFLELFNLNTLSDLPTLKEVQPPPEPEEGSSQKLLQFPPPAMASGLEEPMARRGEGEGGGAQNFNSPSPLSSPLPSPKRFVQAGAKEGEN